MAADQAENGIDVRIVRLDPLRVIAAHGYGRYEKGPEIKSHQILLGWLREHGLSDAGDGVRFFGFDNPPPSPGSPNYGYEFWMTAGPEVQASEPVEVKDFSGGLYAVARCKGTMNIRATWQKLMAWVEHSRYRQGRHQCLEEHLTFRDVQFEDFVLDLYLPIGE